MPRKGFDVPSTKGQKGIPPGVGSAGGAKPKGFDSPALTGNRGKPTKGGFTGAKAPRD